MGLRHAQISDTTVDFDLWQPFRTAQADMGLYFLQAHGSDTI